ncbi:hypothetical protein GGR56DRAFT_677843 [Xylariaceae sp. FL0804]|nr:hypothetical protein GGR56DRAFT_677843 [Xylariaceae sp. FL0804]
MVPVVPKLRGRHPRPRPAGNNLESPCPPLSGLLRIQLLLYNGTAQTPEQRRRNAKFVRDQDARRGKSEAELRKRTRESPKSPISPFWLGILAFVVFGGLVFELVSRVFFR